MSEYKVLISDCITRNEEGIHINSKEFALYYHLKILYDKQKKSKHVQFNHHKFMCWYGIKTNSTLKTMLKNLYSNNLIHNLIEELPRQSNLTIEINEEYVEKKPFTMISVNLYYQMEKIGHEGLRLLYYYESRINRRKDQHQYCFSGIRSISKETKINKNKVKEINDKLSKLKMLKVVKHELTYTDTYDEFDQNIKSKFNNHYTPNLIYISKLHTKKTNDECTD